MSFDLRIFIGGVCAFVPEREVRPGEKNRLWVLLAETEDSQAGGHPLHRHAAELWFDLEDVVGGTEPPPHTPNGVIGVWSLDKDDLSVVDPVRPAAESGLMIASGGRKIDPITGRPVNRRPIAPDDSKDDYSWLPDMGRITGNGAAVKPECFTDPAPLLAARLLLDYGNLSVSTVWTQGPAPQVWSFIDGQNDPGPEYEQAVATWLEARVRVFGDHVDIVSANFPNQAAKRQTLRLTPRNNLDVKVHLTLFSGRKKPANFVADHSFRWIYRLLDFDGPQRIPTRSGAAVHSNLPLDSLTTFCPGGGTKSYP